MLSTARSLVSLSLSLVLAAFLAPSSVAQQLCHTPASVVALGDGTPGVNGVPALATNGTPISGAPGFALNLTQGAPFAPAVILIGNTSAVQVMPTLGGTIFLGKPFHHPRVILDAQGAASLPMPQVATLPAMFCGLTLHAQAIVADASAQGGFSLSNAITITFGYAPGA